MPRNVGISRLLAVIYDAMLLCVVNGQKFAGEFLMRFETVSFGFHLPRRVKGGWPRFAEGRSREAFCCLAFYIQGRRPAASEG